MPHETMQNEGYKVAPTFYEILGLTMSPSELAGISSQIIKSAYRRSLLLHHPDKAPATNRNATEDRSSQTRETYSIDQITEAYNVLLMPKKRAEYDLGLKLQGSAGRQGQQKQTLRTGIETTDLDDLGFDELENVWYMSCRCGDERGFLIKEEDLEEVADEGELGVGCRGCSLWLKVLFGVADEDGAVSGAEGHGKECG